VDEYVARYGAGNFYFASKRFVDWAGPETVGRYVAGGPVTGGSAAVRRVLADAGQRVREELPAVATWLRVRGQADAESAARLLLSGQPTPWAHLKIELIPVRYSTREKSGAGRNA